MRWCRWIRVIDDCFRRKKKRKHNNNKAKKKNQLCVACVANAKIILSAEKKQA